MENFLLCDELQSLRDCPLGHLTCPALLYKGRRKGTVEFVGIWKHNKLDKKYIENGVQLMHLLDHDNVLRFLEWYETPQHIWVITELAIGGSLRDILEQDGFIPGPNIGAFVSDIVAGLDYIHSRGVIYCDLQPGKILLDSCQLLKLSDFTLAKMTDDSQNNFDFKSIVQSMLVPRETTDHPLNSGYAPSPFYAAPELYEGGQFSPATDLWSLGCVVYELSLGCKPFDCDDPKLLIHSICSVETNSSSLQSPETRLLISSLLTREPSNSNCYKTKSACRRIQNHKNSHFIRKHPKMPETRQQARRREAQERGAHDSEAAAATTGDSKIEMQDKATNTDILTHEIKRYQSLGLGRGINVTDSEMWKNKSSFIARKIESDGSNILETEESRSKEHYENEIYTTSAQQLKIRLSLDDPSSQIKIGMDAHLAQSTSSSRKTTGTRVKTKTIAFQVDFSDLALTEEAGRRSGKDNMFEADIARWILNRSSQRRATRNFTLDSDLSNSQKLVGHINDRKKELKGTDKEKGNKARKELKAIMADFRAFIDNVGVTHYVSAIELGAMKYHVSTSNTKSKRIGGGAELSGSGYAEGGVSGLTEFLSFFRSDYKHEIGSIEKVFDEGSSGEAVIGFDIQPIYTLLRAPTLQYTMRKVVKEYIFKKTDKSEGPFLISCKINRKSVYWKVYGEGNVSETQCQSLSMNETQIAPITSDLVSHRDKPQAESTPDTSFDDLGDSGLEKSSLVPCDEQASTIMQDKLGPEQEESQLNLTNLQSMQNSSLQTRHKCSLCSTSTSTWNEFAVIGTTNVHEASLFYIIPTDSDFLIAYWGKKRKDRKMLMNLTESHASKRKVEPSLPRYLSANTSLFGASSGPLELQSTVLIQEARFCLHHKVRRSFPLMMCASTSISVNDWIGGEEFFVKCSQQSFKMNGFIAMNKQGSSFKTVTKLPVGDPSSQSDNTGMLFRLHSTERKKKNDMTDGPEVGSSDSEDLASDFEFSDTEI